MQACLQALQRCSLSFAKIVQTESRDASLLASFAEVQPILCKDSATESRGASLLAIFAEVQPILCKVKKKYPFKQGCFKQGCFKQGC